MAQKLGRTVRELRESLSQAEYIGWTRFYAIKNQREQLEAAKIKGK